MRRHTVIDLREDGPHVVPDRSNDTVIYSPEVVEALRADGALPRLLAPEQDTMKNPTPDYRAGVAAGLGSFFDALVNKGYPPSTVNELLWAAYENVKART